MPTITFEDNLSAEGTFSTFDSDADDTRIKFDQLEETILMLKKDKSLLQQNLEEGNLEFNELHGLCTQSYERNKKLEERNKELEERNKELKERNEELEERNEELEERNEELEERNEELEENLRTICNESTELHEKHSATLEYSNVLKSKEVEYQENVNKLNKEINNLLNNNKEKNETNFTLTQLQEEHLKKQKRIRYIYVANICIFVSAAISLAIVGVLKFAMKKLLKQYPIIDTICNFSGAGITGMTVAAGIHKLFISKVDILDAKQNRNSIKLQQ